MFYFCLISWYLALLSIKNYFEILENACSFAPKQKVVRRHGNLSEHTLVHKHFGRSLDFRPVPKYSRLGRVKFRNIVKAARIGLENIFSILKDGLDLNYELE